MEGSTPTPPSPKARDYPAPATPRTHPSRRWDRSYLQVSAKSCYAVKRCKPDPRRPSVGGPRLSVVGAPRSAVVGGPQSSFGGNRSRRNTGADGLHHGGDGGLSRPGISLASSALGRPVLTGLTRSPSLADGESGAGSPSPPAFSSPRTLVGLLAQEDIRASVGQLKLDAVRPCSVCERERDRAQDFIDREKQRRAGVVVLPRLVHEPGRSAGGSQSARPAIPDVSPIALPGTQLPPLLLRAQGGGAQTERAPITKKDSFASRLQTYTGEDGRGPPVAPDPPLDSPTAGWRRRGGSFARISEGPEGRPSGEGGGGEGGSPTQDPAGDPPGKGGAEGGDGGESPPATPPPPPRPPWNPPVWVKLHDDPGAVEVSRIGRHSIMVTKVPETPSETPRHASGEVSAATGRLIRRIGRSASWRENENSFMRLLRQATDQAGSEPEPERAPPYVPRHTYCRRHLHLDPEALRAVEEERTREQTLGRLAVRRIRRQTREERDRARKNQKIQNRIRELEAEGDLGGDPELVRSLLQYGDARPGGETEELMESKLREFSGVAIMRSAIQQRSSRHNLLDGGRDDEGERGGGSPTLAERRALLESPGRSMGQTPPRSREGAGGRGRPPTLQRGGAGSRSVAVRGQTGTTIQSVRAARKDPLLAADMSMATPPPPESVSWSLDVSSFGERRRVADSRGYLDGQGVLRDRFRREWSRLKSRRAFIDLVASGGGGAGAEGWEGMDGVERAFWAHYAALSQAFHYYSLVGAIGDACFALPLPRLVLLVDDTGLQLPEGALGRAYHAALEREAGEGGAGWPEPSAGLQRFEFLHCVALLAVAQARARPAARRRNLAEAVDALCGGHLAPGLPPEARVDPNEFRKERLYKEHVDMLLKDRLHQLRAVYRAWCERRGAPRLSMETWVKCLQESLLISSVTAVTAHEAKLCFTLSQHVIVDELDPGKRKHLSALSYLEFLEALARLADLVSMPPAWALLRSYQANEGDSWDLRHDGTKRGPWWDRETPTPIPGSNEPLPTLEDAPYFYLKQSFLDGAEEWRRASQGLLAPNSRPLEEKLRTVLDVIWKHHTMSESKEQVPALRPLLVPGGGGKWAFGGST